MKIDMRKLTWDELDEIRRPAPGAVDFDRVVAAALSRRGFLRGVVAVGSGAAAMGLGGVLGTTSAQAQGASRFGFTPIPIGTDHEVHVPEGYVAQVVVRWGDPLFSDAPAFDPATGGTAASAARAAGDNTDGMEMFVIGNRQVLAVNNEYTNLDILLVETAAAAAAAAEEAAAAATTEEEKAAAMDYAILPASAEEVAKIQAVQGVTIVELAEGAEGWAIVVDSEFNRRIDHTTPMRLSGPAAGHALLMTAADPTGTEVLGTINNCGAGRTPWGTYLTCEENFNGYFGSSTPDAALPEGFDRYGIAAEGGYGYELFDARFDIAQTPNEPHRFGYVVEIDPSDAASVPVKRTALGRIKHENAALTLARDGRVVVYLGDDERGEFLYKYVSAAPYVPGQPTDALLDEGQLHVARFGEDGTGEWLALTPEATGMDQATIHVHTRQAASAVGATTMDRPEWVAINPLAIEAYCCLTNNTRRAADATNAGGDAMVPVEGSPNPRADNGYGQIVRWYPDDGDHAAATFAWDLFVMAGNPAVHQDAYAGSPNVNESNMFNSPDGMMFDQKGLVWIQTDGDDSNEGDFAGQGNNQMLVGDPATGEIARFMTGPKGSEVTGLAFSADRRTVFAGIQHPGGSWPDGAGLPRSSIVAIRREDGAIIA